MTILPTQRFQMPLLLTLIAGWALVSVSASAGILTMSPGEKSIEGVKLSNTAVFQSEGKPVTLKLYASGLRKKKVALFWAKVYVGQIFAAEGLASPPKSITEGFDTISKQPLAALTMTFVRDVSVDRIKTGFAESLEANGIDPKSDAIKPFFAVVEKAGEAKDHLTTTIVFERRKDGSEWVYFENGSQMNQSLAVEKGMIAKLLSIWLGKPADSGMEKLHDQFLGKED